MLKWHRGTNWNLYWQIHCFVQFHMLNDCTLARPALHWMAVALSELLFFSRDLLITTRSVMHQLKYVLQRRAAKRFWHVCERKRRGEGRGVKCSTIECYIELNGVNDPRDNNYLLLSCNLTETRIPICARGRLQIWHHRPYKRSWCDAIRFMCAELYAINNEMLV